MHTSARNLIVALSLTMVAACGGEAESTEPTDDLEAAEAVNGDPDFLQVYDSNVENLETLRYELETFVCEGEYESGLRRILQGYVDNFGKEQEFEGTVIAAIGGKPSEGSFKEHPEKK